LKRAKAAASGRNSGGHVGSPRAQGDTTTSELFQEVAAIVRKHPLEEVPSPGKNKARTPIKGW